MSSLPISYGLGGFSGLISIIGKRQRSLGTLVADAVLEEHHLDQMRITDHPVEYGSVISDHSYRMPSEITLVYGWSLCSTGIVNAAFRAFTEGAQILGDNKLNQIYTILLNLQINRTVFSVLTGRRAYQNMMLTGLALTTDKDTENAMIVKATCREIIFASATVAPIQPASAQSVPQATATPINSGMVSLNSGAAYNATAAP